ncbi:hypothetical protein [Dethiobacter alkaliphilus]|uniref:Uncharacterized protein n=1 Tax=Dethiobacter alkaliphilus AHT 1 TaxID=555088 RepID=C0GHT2_DETAL|nr:hypothetical protein [Dethiobacter alkaliphilus]EEG77006.1 hypothetical protein DealDRAFT_2041 [Dethiobacter alkaliphilus AHT 1]
MKVEEINTDRDRLFDDQEIIIVSGNADSVHRVKSYIVNGGAYDGLLYHKFYYISGNPVTNYGDDEYRQLSRYINICDEDAEIFFVEPTGVIINVNKAWRLASCVR